MLDAGCWISRIAQMVKSKNIQHPDASIQDQLTLATVFIVAAWVKCNILCNYRVKLRADPVMPRPAWQQDHWAADRGRLLSPLA